jgi:uncharacterized heparinase superfamily protein
MARAGNADRSSLSLRGIRRGINRARGRVSAWSAGLPKLPGRGDRLVIAPQDLRTADPTRAAEIYSGRFSFAGKVVVCDGRSPFEMLEPSDEWRDALLGFAWLRHLRAADSAVTRAHARALVDEWIGLQGRWNTPAWRPEILSRRIISWLTHAPLILDDADERFYRRFVRSLTRQISYLRITAGDARDGVPRLQARIALTFGTLCAANQIRHLRKTTQQLVSELERQILPDGGHVSRNPEALITLLLDLLPLGQTFTARNLAPPPALLNAVDRMMPMLRFFRHGDGAFGLFNGMGPTPRDLVATLVAYDDAHGSPVTNAVHSGYQRLDAGDAVVLMDTGRPPKGELSAEAHAGCLSFEFSWRTQRIIVNCGMPETAREDWRAFARATAAHSTVTFNETSSCRFGTTSKLRRYVGIPIVAGPTRVPVDREVEDDGTIVVRASHDGYAARLSVLHQRTIILAPDGHRLDGEDLFLSARGDTLPAKTADDFAIRFFLHPAIRVTPATDRHSATLVLPNRDNWLFDAHEDTIEVEDGAFLGGQDGPRRTLQIVIRGHARNVPRVSWTLLHNSPAARASRAARGEEPDSPA